MEIYRHCVYGLTKSDIGTDTAGLALFTSLTPQTTPALSITIVSHLNRAIKPKPCFLIVTL